MTFKKVNSKHEKFHYKIISLTFLFFILCVVLVIAAIFSFRAYYYPKSALSEGEYVIFEKIASNENCDTAGACKQIVKVYNTGRLLVLGDIMINTNLDAKKFTSLVNTINSNGILFSECKSKEKSSIKAEYVIKLGLQVKRISYPGCAEQLRQLESIIFE